ncbi:hypothetical protein B1759_09420 [Rubrivirga sp. SAORIC476]|nr:hypothetical protein B1759_09420 [Rubrivirga sp. SAORIC476]
MFSDTLFLRDHSMLRLLPVLALFVLVASGCDTAAPDRNGIDVTALGHDADALVGTWDLVTVTPSGECMGEDCTRTRPAEEVGQSARLVFRADGTATYTSNETVSAEGNYRVSAPEPGDSPRLTIGDARYVFGIDRDRLYIEHRYLDGPLLEFRRR